MECDPCRVIHFLQLPETEMYLAAAAFVPFQYAEVPLYLFSCCIGRALIEHTRQSWSSPFDTVMGCVHSTCTLACSHALGYSMSASHLLTPVGNDQEVHVRLVELLGCEIFVCARAGDTFASVANESPTINAKLFLFVKLWRGAGVGFMYEPRTCSVILVNSAAGAKLACFRCSHSPS
jgi:hypothetical protein